MKSSALSSSVLILLMAICPCAHATTNSNQDDQNTNPWGSNTGSALNYASTWAAPTPSNTSSDSLPEVEKIKRRMGDFLSQSMEDLQKKGYVAPQGYPRTDVLDKDGAYYLLMDIPGMRKDLINIEVKGQEITISGDRKVEDEFKTSNLIKVERRYGNFQRIYAIPEEFIADQISAKYENGVLQVRIPKKNSTTVVKPKTIAIT